MGNTTVPIYRQTGYILSGVHKQDETYNTRVALWHLPYSKDYLQFDDDDSKWFEEINKWGEDELTPAQQGLKMDFERYKVKTKTTQYSDDTYEVENRYPNKNVVIEKHGKNHIMVWIKDKFNQLVAEKIFNGKSNEGRKVVYKNITKDDNTFTVVQVYSYDTSKNRASDIVNYGYTSSVQDFVKGCKLENEYYMLNNKQVKVTKTDTGEYKVNSKNGKTFTFLVE